MFDFHACFIVSCAQMQGVGSLYSLCCSPGQVCGQLRELQKGDLREDLLPEEIYILEEVKVLSPLNVDGLMAASTDGTWQTT